MYVEFYLLTVQRVLENTQPEMQVFMFSFHVHSNHVQFSCKYTVFRYSFHVITHYLGTVFM